MSPPAPTAAEQAQRDFAALLARLNLVAMAVRLGQLRLTAAQALELRDGIQYLGETIKRQRETPALEQPRQPSVIQQGHDATADFLRAINNPATVVLGRQGD